MSLNISGMNSDLGPSYVWSSSKGQLQLFAGKDNALEVKIVLPDGKAVLVESQSISGLPPDLHFSSEKIKECFSQFYPVFSYQKECGDSSVHFFVKGRGGMWGSGRREENTRSLEMRCAIGGGIGFDFNAMNTKKYVDFSHDSPSWCQVSQGLSLRGRCTNGGCAANGQTIYIKFGIGKFDIAREMYKAKCPQCGQNAKDVKTPGFWDCKYVVDGHMLRPEEKDVHLEDVAGKDKYLTFEDGDANWAYLEITTTPG